MICLFAVDPFIIVEILYIYGLHSSPAGVETPASKLKQRRRPVPFPYTKIIMLVISQQRRRPVPFPYTKIIMLEVYLAFATIALARLFVASVQKDKPSNRSNKSGGKIVFLCLNST